MAADRDTLLRILDLARWAPSGDNTQPWRFEIVDDGHIAIHGHDTRDHVIYDFQGHASHIAHGALLETLRIAATRFGLGTTWTWRQGSPDSAPIYDVRLVPDPAPPDPLADFIETRCVQRRPMRIMPLRPEQKAALEAAVAPDHTLRFFESWAERRSVAQMLWRNAHIRLTSPEAYRVHAEVIEWGARFSEDRIPDQAVGVDPLTALLMRWVMKRWQRVAFFNRYLAGTIPPRIQLDLLPALACSAHVLLLPREPLDQMPTYVRAGVAMQRLWLTATAQGLHLQPEMTPVIFRWYVQAQRTISTTPGLDAKAAALARTFEALAGGTADASYAFFGRIGTSAPPRARSTRRKLQDLLVSS